MAVAAGVASALAIGSAVHFGGIGSTASAAAPMASMADELATYSRLGWQVLASVPDADPQGAGAVAQALANVRLEFFDLDTEGDDLWTSVWMWKRTGKQWYRDRAQAWADFYESIDYTCANPTLNAATSSFCYGIDAYNPTGRSERYATHTYGWGLVDWYEQTGDAVALQKAKDMARAITPNRDLATHGGSRAGARFLMLYNRLAETTGEAEFVNGRNTLIQRFLTDPRWTELPAWNGGGMFNQNNLSSFIGGGNYGQQSFMMGIVTFAFWDAYRTTGNAGLRDRLIKMAKYADVYGFGD